ncbi:hypothetical protein GCM10011488_14260 [Steroidobacter agaridevorans]|nr:hypothetical protein GCM10011488_14260 [Steroidobacter agaridevorans]
MSSGAMKRFVDEGSCPHATQAKAIATTAVATFVPYSNMLTPSKAIAIATSKYYGPPLPLNTVTSARKGVFDAQTRAAVILMAPPHFEPSKARMGQPAINCDQRV